MVLMASPQRHFNTVKILHQPLDPDRTSRQRHATIMPVSPEDRCLLDLVTTSLPKLESQLLE